MRSVLLASFIWVLAFIIPASSNAQDLSGIWRGYFRTESGEQYKLEFQVKQNPALAVTGVSYSYLDTRFYGKATMTGNYQLTGSSFTIQETRTVEVKNMGGGGTCLMNYKFTYTKEGKEEFLEGTYVGKTENRANPDLNGKWGDCGSGTVFLRKVPTSDFYVEPFLRQPTTPMPKATTPVITPKPSTPRPSTPKPSTPKPSTTKPAAPKPRVNKPVTPPAQQPVKRDTVAKRQPQAVAPAPKEVTPVVVNKVPVETRNRDNDLVKTIKVSSDKVTIRIYDNGEIDDDTLSVYLDNKPLLMNKRLSTVPITAEVNLSASNPDHTLVMVAENMGRIPPNTSVMIVQDGDKRYEVSLTSTNQKNAMVRFQYDPPSH